MYHGSRTGTSGAGAGPGRTPRHGRPVMGRGSAVLVISAALGVLLASAVIHAPGWAPAFGQADRGMQGDPTAGGLGCDGTYYRYSDERLTAALVYQFGGYLGLDQSFVDEHLLAVPGNEIGHLFQQQVGIAAEMDRLDRAMEEIDIQLDGTGSEPDRAVEVLDARIDRHDSSLKSLVVKMEVLDRAAEGIVADMERYGEYDMILGRYVIHQNFLDDPVDRRRAMALYGQINETDRERVLLVDEQRRVGNERMELIREKNGMMAEGGTAGEQGLVEEYNLLVTAYNEMAARYNCIGDTIVRDARAERPAAETAAAVHPRDVTHRIGYVDVPGFADGTVEVPALEQAVRMWEGANAGLELVITEAEPDVTVLWAKTIPGDAAGTHGTAPGGDPVIIAEVGDYGCDGRYHPYSQDYIAYTLAHELGHHMGIGHVTTGGHLMSGPGGTSPGAFNSLGYMVPRVTDHERFLLQEALSYMMDGTLRELDALSASLVELNGTLNGTLAEYEEMDAEYRRVYGLYSAYPSSMESDIAHRAAKKHYDQLIEMRDGYDSLAEDVNGLVDEHNENVKQMDAMGERYGLLAGRYGCMGNAEGPAPYEDHICGAGGCRERENVETAGPPTRGPPKLVKI